MAANDSNSTRDVFSCLPLVEHQNLLKESYGVWFKIFSKSIIAINAVSSICSASANLVFIWAIARTASLRSPSKFLLLGLLAANLGIAIIPQPAYCIMKFAEYIGDLNLFCSSGYVFSASIWGFGSTSFCMLTAVTADRFLAITLHLRYKEVVTPRRCLIAMGIIWSTCMVSCPVCRILILTWERFVFFSFVMFILLCLNCYFLFTIYMNVHKHSRHIQRELPATNTSPRIRKSIKTMNCIVGAFVVCHFPYFASLVALTVSDFTNTMRCLLAVAETLVMFNGVLNPIIYCWKVQEIREAAYNSLANILKRQPINAVEIQTIENLTFPCQPNNGIYTI